MEMGGEAGAQYREVGDGSVDYKGMVPLRATTGAWKASLFIIGNYLTRLVLYSALFLLVSFTNYSYLNVALYN